MTGQRRIGNVNSIAMLQSPQLFKTLLLLQGSWLKLWVTEEKIAAVDVKSNMTGRRQLIPAYRELVAKVPGVRNRCPGKVESKPITIGHNLDHIGIEIFLR